MLIKIVLDQCILYSEGICVCVLLNFIMHNGFDEFLLKICASHSPNGEKECPGIFSVAFRNSPELHQTPLLRYH